MRMKHIAFSKLLMAAISLLVLHRHSMEMFLDIMATRIIYGVITG